MLRPSWLMTSSCKLKLEHKRQQTRKKLANFRLIFLSNLHVNLWCSPSSAVCLLHCAFFFFFRYSKKSRNDKFCQNCLIYTTLVTFFTRHCICVSDSLKERCTNLTLIQQANVNGFTRNGTADSKGTVLVAAVMPNENCYCNNQNGFRCR